jgi:serine protease Do
MIPGWGELSERLRRSTARVTAGGSRESSGSGVIWTPDGTIVTNAHVVTGSQVEVELWDGHQYPAEVVDRDLRRDLAKLRVKALDIPAATIGDSNSIRTGELVVAAGNPLGFIGAIATGVVHAVGPIRGLGVHSWVQAALRLAPGNSGGPLANTQGRVIGINTMIAGGLALAIPTQAVLKFLASGASSPTLGVVVRPLLWNRPERRLGLMILEIQPGSAAAQASLFPRDIITGINGEPLRTPNQLSDALDRSENGVLRLQFLRDRRSRVREVAIELRNAQGKAA